ncbi:MAG: GatB/YqeY domain-containing protein [Pseudomonadales bacterium]|nr:GatB/YqeY domain-containing protein [Pseudomonadales bacterium]|tara:strand:+ start:24 stop:479 length:456 start_codon:yes stop_codon:yes gene_type:complete
MSESLKDRLQNDVKDAMRARAKQTLGTLRLIMAELKRREVDERIELSDQDVLVILEKMVKQRRDSLSQYLAADRQDLADQEQFELDLIAQYLPEPLSDEAVLALIEEAIEAAGAREMSKMGQVMGSVKDRAQGRVDMAKVGQLVKAQLNQG